jgi:hypothetical protein
LSTTGNPSDETSGAPSVRVQYRAAFKANNEYALERSFPFERFYTLAAQRRRDRALDVIFVEMTSAFELANWVWCDRVLDTIDLTKLDSHLAIGFLSVTYALRDRLGARARLLARVREWLPTQGKSTAQVESLLRGLV